MVTWFEGRVARGRSGRRPGTQRLSSPPWGSTGRELPMPMLGKVDAAGSKAASTLQHGKGAGRLFRWENPATSRHALCIRAFGGGAEEGKPYFVVLAGVRGREAWAWDMTIRGGAFPRLKGLSDKDTTFWAWEGPGFLLWKRRGGI